MVLTAYVHNTWRVQRSTTNSSHDNKFWNCVCSFLLVTIDMWCLISTAYCRYPLKILPIIVSQVLLTGVKEKDYGCCCLSLVALTIVWRKYTFWMLDTGRHCIGVMCDQFFTVSLWRLTLFSFLAVVILESSSLYSSVISVVESECCGEKKWQWQRLDWRSHHFLDKLSPGHKSEIVSYKT